MLVTRFNLPSSMSLAVLLVVVLGCSNFKVISLVGSYSRDCWVLGLRGMVWLQGDIGMDFFISYSGFILNGVVVYLESSLMGWMAFGLQRSRRKVADLDPLSVHSFPSNFLRRIRSAS